MVNLRGVKELVGSRGDADATAIIEVLSRVLTQLIDLNRNVTSKQQCITKFQSSYPPTISILAYLERINKYAKCSPNCFIIALIYIDRLIETRNVILSTLNVHRVLITSVMLATKVFDDEFYKNAYYAKLGGVSTQEMNSLELEYLGLMNFDFFVTVETFEKYQKELSAFVSPSAPQGEAAGHEHLSSVGGLGLTTPSPPVLLSCGQYQTPSQFPTPSPSTQQQQQHFLGALGQPSQSQPPAASRDPCEHPDMTVVVPLAYDFTAASASGTPPPPHQLHQPAYYSSQSQSQVPPRQHHPAHQQQQRVAFPQQLGVVKGYGLQAPGAYGAQAGSGGSGHYITPVTTPTSVAEAVFSWGSGDGSVAVGGGSVCGNGNAATALQQQQMMMRFNGPTQLFPPHCYHPRTPNLAQQQQQQHFPPAPPLTAPFGQGAGAMQPPQGQHVQQPYFYPLGSHVSQSSAAFSAPSHPLLQQHRCGVVAGGGGGGQRSVWGTAGP